MMFLYLSTLSHKCKLECKNTQLVGCFGTIVNEPKNTEMIPAVTIFNFIEWKSLEKEKSWVWRITPFQIKLILLNLKNKTKNSGMISFCNLKKRVLHGTFPIKHSHMKVVEFSIKENHFDFKRAEWIWHIVYRQMKRLGPVLYTVNDAIADLEVFFPCFFELHMIIEILKII